jgi:GT2 family glycosyltransferase
MAGHPLVRIGIVSWNTDALLARCLDAVPAAIGGYGCEVVVVDNASTDRSLAVARGRGLARVVANDANVGYARAMNRALAGTDAEVLIAINPDTEPPPGSLATLVDRLLADADLGLVVPRLVYPDGAAQHSVYRFPSALIAAVVCFAPPRLHHGALGRRLWLEGSGMPRGSDDIDWAVGAVHVLRSAALGGRPPYDERWFMYVEDLELCWRLARTGWRRRVEADVTVTHVRNAAGAQAWGRSQTARWIDATYDWYARDRGLVAMRAYAAINTIGAALHVGLLGLGAVVGATSRAVARRTRARDLALVLPRHLRAAVLGPPPVSGEATR